MKSKAWCATTIALALSLGPSHALAQTNGPITIERQGSFAIGGTVITAPGTFDPINDGAFNPRGMSTAGQTLHGDHLYASYQIPVKPRELPLVLWHGHGQSGKTWETTPDGREGFGTIFLRRRFPIYIIDQPRRGRAARSTQPVNLPVVPDEQLWYGIFRLGAWPNLYPGVQFSKDPAALDQFFRQMTPNTGPYDPVVNTDAASALFSKIGPAVLVTHSQSGTLGWLTAIRNPAVKAIVSFEPGGNFVFPDDDVPQPLTHVGGPVNPTKVPRADFLKLTKIPIVVYYGDNIPEQPDANPGKDQWRAFQQMARLWRDTVNRNGGDVTLVELPKVGIRGNTHFPMSDLNNVVIADHLSAFLRSKGLDR